jgi:hypothetical protein
MRDHSAVLAESVLRHRARVAEHCAGIETELASKVKSEFITNMSHALRTPSALPSCSANSKSAGTGTGRLSSMPISFATQPRTCSP